MQMVEEMKNEKACQLRITQLELILLKKENQEQKNYQSQDITYSD